MTAIVPDDDGVVLPGDAVRFAPFALPGFTGETEAAFLNTDVGRAPFLALLRLPPGGVLARHYHTEAREAVYVLEGTMINDGVPLPAGSVLAHGPGTWHGPHATETGCTILFIQSVPVGPDGSVFET